MKPQTKGYRAALKLARQLPGHDRETVAGFLSWFYGKHLNLVTQNLQSVPAPTDAELHYPRYPFHTAGTDAARIVAREGGRDAALSYVASIDEQLRRVPALSDEEADRMVGYWHAVARIIATTS